MRYTVKMIQFYIDIFMEKQVITENPRSPTGGMGSGGRDERDVGGENPRLAI